MSFFCDISKAFDRVWHNGLLFKLERYGITGRVLRWFVSYLSNRMQRVVLNGCFSAWKPVRAGVPQGSILGPLLFLIFINDIVNDIDACIKLFADDTSLYVIVETPEIAARALNRDIEMINQWANQWLVRFNPQKTESLLITRKRILPVHPPLQMNNFDIQEVVNHKHLGLYFSNDGTWHSHIDYIVKKAYNQINILRRVRLVLDRFTLEKM